MPADSPLMPPPPVPSYATVPVMAPPPPAAPPAGDSGPGTDPPMIDFAGLWQALKRRWPVPFLGALLLAAGAGWYLWQSPSYYTAVAELAVEQQQSSFLPGESFKPEDLRSLEVLKSIEREITGQGILLRVANQHALRVDPAFAPPRKDGLPYQDDEIVNLLRRRVTATLERGTRHIVITVDDTDPERARAICESILTQATRQSTDQTSEAARLANKTLSAEKLRIEAKVEASQQAVNLFREKYPMLPLEENLSELKTNSVEEAVRSTASAAAAARAEAVRLENTVAQIEAAGGRVEALLRLSDIGQREDVSGLKRVLGEKESAFTVIDAEYGPKHPRHQQALRELNETRSQLASTVGRAVSLMRNRLEKQRQDAGALEEALTRRKEESVIFQQVAGEFATLVSMLKADRDNYARLLSRLKDAEVNTALGDSVLRITDAPLKPTWPSKPRRKLMTAAAGVLGFSLGTGLVLLLHFLDRSLRTIQAGENLLRLPGLAAIPEDPVTTLKGSLLHGREGAAAQTEAFRSLRTALSILGKGSAARTYLFTAARAGEGTSYTAMNFAVSLAQQGYRTLLIDANLRQPSLDGVFLAERPATGLADHLSGKGTRDASACQKTEIPGVYVFAAGTSPRHPSEVLNEQAFALMLRDAAKWFHKIVIDTPAVGQVTDALPLARHVDTVCLVVRAAATPRAEVLRAANKLTMSGARPAGFILNAAPAEALSGGFVGDFAAGFSPPPPLRALPESAVL